MFVKGYKGLEWMKNQLAAHCKGHSAPQNTRVKKSPQCRKNKQINKYYLRSEETQKSINQK